MKNDTKTQENIDTQKFRSTTVAHPRLMAKIEELMSEINNVEPGDIIFLYGPTGVGKSTLGKNIKSRLDKEFRKEMGSDPSIIPVLLIEAPHPDGPKFSWKDHYRRALKTLGEPLISKKQVDLRYSESKWNEQDDRAAGHELRMVFENALEYRKVRVLLIDEAHHMARGASTKVSLQGLLDYIKSQANLTKTIIVLIGTYELLALRNLSGQLSRRSTDIHFSRYRFDDADDQQIFFNVVESFFGKMPIPHKLDLTELNDKFYVNSAGCIGILSTWLKKALKLAVRNKDPFIAIEHLEKTVLTLQQLMKITEELESGESLLKPDGNAEEIIRARLGLLSPQAKVNKNDSAASIESKPKETRPKGRPPRVGKRKPARDKVGRDSIELSGHCNV